MNTKELEIEQSIHDSFYTFETSLRGKPTVLLGKENHTTVIIPVCNLAAEDSRLIKAASDTVYIDKSYFIFKEVISLNHEGAVHSPDKKHFTDRFSTHKEFPSPGKSEVYKTFELGSFGLLEDGSSYDGKFEVACRQCFLTIPEQSQISTAYPGPISFESLPEEVISFLLGKAEGIHC